MAITVRELLAEPHLRLTLLAGGEGLDRPIEWTHSSDLPHPWEWAGENHLLMTNGDPIPPAPDEQVSFARMLSEAKISALAIGVGMNAPPISMEFKEFCDEAAFPVLEVPYPLPFIAISKVVAEANLIEQSTRTRRTARLYDLARSHLEKSETTATLLEQLGKETGTELAIVDGSCGHRWFGSIDVTGPLISMEIPGASQSRLAVSTASTSEVDQTLLLHAALVLGVALSNEALRMEQLNSFGVELFTQTASLTSSAENAKKWLAGVGVDSDLVRFVTISSNSSHEVLANIPQRLRQHGVATMSFLQNETLRLVTSGELNLTPLAHAIPENAKCGVGSPVMIGNLIQSRQEADWAVSSMNRPGVNQYEESDPWMGLTDAAQGALVVRRTLGALIEYDKVNATTLVETLERYLSLNRSPQRVADEMFVHRQTVIHRLKRIEEVSSKQLSDTASLAEFWVALKIYSGSK